MGCHKVSEGKELLGGGGVMGGEDWQPSLRCGTKDYANRRSLNTACKMLRDVLPRFGGGTRSLPELFALLKSPDTPI